MLRIALKISQVLELLFILILLMSKLLLLSFNRDSVLIGQQYNITSTNNLILFPFEFISHTCTRRLLILNERLDFE